MNHVYQSFIQKKSSGENLVGAIRHRPQNEDIVRPPLPQRGSFYKNNA